MSNNLDKSLDDILASKPRVRRPRKAASSAKKTGAVTKPSTASKKAVTKEKKKASHQKSAVNDPIAAYAALADRVIISNLPTDVSEASVKEYFSHEIGPITKCLASFNARGQLTGTVTVTFKRPGDASKAVNKFNGTSIDEGARTMRVELVMDPNRKPLAARLNPSAVPAPRKEKKVTGKPAAGGNAKKQGDKKKPAPKSKANAKRPKKTVEELDAEMSEYFGSTNAGETAAATAAASDIPI